MAFCLHSLLDKGLIIHQENNTIERNVPYRTDKYMPSFHFKDKHVNQAMIDQFR